MQQQKAFQSAARRLGMILTIFLLAISMQAADTVITVTGTITGGADGAKIFQAGKAWNDLPFQLVFRFDDRKGVALRPHASCPSGGSGINSIPGSSPGTAVLTINGVPYEFGKQPKARSIAYRSIASSCSESGLRFEVDEGDLGYFSTVLNVMALPKEGIPSLTQTPDWRAPMSSTAVKEWTNESGFNIVRDGQHQSSSRFTIKTVSVAKGETK